MRVFILSAWLLLAFVAQAQDRTKGWQPLIESLHVDLKANKNELERLFADPRMPPREMIPFALIPADPRYNYRDVAETKRIKRARQFLANYNSQLLSAERTFGVEKEFIVAILLIESDLGENHAVHPIFYRLARIAATSLEDNIIWNTARLRETDPLIPEEGVRARAQYLKSVFAPQLIAVLTTAERMNVDPLEIKGSIAGAFGFPQFLPSSYLTYGVDGDNNGVINLSTFPDAIASIGFYLKAFGWKPGLSHDEQLKVLFHYNKSVPYGEAVIRVARALPLKHRVR